MIVKILEVNGEKYCFDAFFDKIHGALFISQDQAAEFSNYAMDLQFKILQENSAHKTIEIDRGNNIHFTDKQQNHYFGTGFIPNFQYSGELKQISSVDFRNPIYIIKTIYEKPLNYSNQMSFRTFALPVIDANINLHNTISFEFNNSKIVIKPTFKKFETVDSLSITVNFSDSETKNPTWFYDIFRYYFALVFGSNQTQNKLEFSHTESITHKNTSEERTFYQFNVFSSVHRHQNIQIIELNNNTFNEKTLTDFFDYYKENSTQIQMYLNSRMNEAYANNKLTNLLHQIEGFFRTHYPWAREFNQNKSRYVVTNKELYISFMNGFYSINENSLERKQSIEFNPNNSIWMDLFTVDNRFYTKLLNHRNYYTHLYSNKQLDHFNSIEILVVSSILDILFRAHIIFAATAAIDTNTINNHIAQTISYHLNSYIKVPDK